MATVTLRGSSSPMAYRDEGDGLPVVLIHAFPLDGSMWDAQVDALRDRHRLIVPDLPGFCQSGIAEGLTVDSAADAIGELLAHLGVTGRVVIVGLSLGGYIALAFARLYPQQVRGMVLADTKAPADDSAAREGRRKMIQVAQADGAKGVADAMGPRVLGKTTLDRRPEVVERVRAMVERQSTAGIVTALTALRSRPDATPGLGHISVPTLVIVGEEDGVTPPDVADELARNIPNARMVRIPEAGHLTNLEQPELFSRELSQFLSEIEAGNQ